MYAGVLPGDNTQIRLVGKTFAKHCDWAQFFVSPPSAEESRRSWSLPRNAGGHTVVNLVQEFPDAREDDNRYMQTKQGTNAQFTRKRLWDGNTIQKSLLTAVYVATYRLKSADIFCWLELDSAFVAENMRAFARAHDLDPTNQAFFFSSLSMGMKFDPNVGIFPHTGGGLCITQKGLERLAAVLVPMPKKTVRYPWPTDPAVFVPAFFANSDPKSKVLNGCGYLAGHWWDVMLGRCLLVANVSAHPGLVDDLGRYYFSTSPLPCREHDADGTMNWLEGRYKPSPTSSRIQNLAHAICYPLGFGPELFRYAVCEPKEVVANADYWISPYNIGFHRYKNLSKHLQAYRILYNGAQCDWMTSYRPQVLRVDSTLI